MADPRTAKVISVEESGINAKLFRIRMTDDVALGHIPGQYIIVNSGVTMENGKLAKRAYSIMGDGEPEFSLAVYKVNDGPCSNYMHNLVAGDTLTFSGSWGKFYLDDKSFPESINIIATRHRHHRGHGVAGKSRCPKRYRPGSSAMDA